VWKGETHRTATVKGGGDVRCGKERLDHLPEDVGPMRPVNLQGRREMLGRGVNQVCKELVMKKGRAHRNDKLQKKRG